jgi:2-dehydro-3-deoxygalactonokinase
VLGSLPRAHVSEFLSGLLIGAEVATLSQHFRDSQVTIVGGEALANRYQQALSTIGRQTSVVSGDNAFQTGVRSIIHAVAN